jgi:hypothetical protein
MGSPDKGFRLDAYPPDINVVEAKERNGSDGFTCGGLSFISKRAKESMESTPTRPLELAPALLNIEGVEEKFRRN